MLTFLFLLSAYKWAKDTCPQQYEGLIPRQYQRASKISPLYGNPRFLSLSPLYQTLLQQKNMVLD
jgi:hypothetical protein